MDIFYTFTTRALKFLKKLCKFLMVFSSKGYYVGQLVVHDKLGGRGPESRKHGIRAITL